VLNWSAILLWLLVVAFSTKNNLITLEPFRRFNLGHLARTCVWGVTSSDWTKCKFTWTWERNKPKMDWDWGPKYTEGYRVAEKMSVSSHNRPETDSGHLQLNICWWLAKYCLFCILTCSNTLLSILVKVWNVNLIFCIKSINVCSLTIWIYICIYIHIYIDLLQLRP